MPRPAGLVVVAQPCHLRRGGGQQRGIVPGVQHHIGSQSGHGAPVGELRRAQQIAAAQLDAVDAEPVSCDVEQLLTRDGALVPPGRPVGAAWCLVGEYDLDPAPVGGHAVRAGQHRDRQLGHRDAVGAAVGAVVVHHLVRQGGDPALSVERGGDSVRLLPGMVHRDQVLGAVLRPLDGPAQRAGQPRNQVVLGIELAAYPEPAARVDGVHVDEVLVDPEHGGEHVPVEHRNLGHAEDRQRSGSRLGGSQQRARLQRHAAVPAYRDLDLHHVRGPPERGGGVAVAEGEIGGDVPGWEQARRAWAARLGRVEHRRFLIDVDLDEFGGILGGIRVVGDNDGERFPHVPHHVGGQHRLQVAAEVDALDG